MKLVKSWRVLLLGTMVVTYTTVGCSPAHNSSETEIAEQLKDLHSSMNQVLARVGVSHRQENLDRLQAIQNRLLAPDAITATLADEFNQFRDLLPAFDALELAQQLNDVRWLIQVQRLLTDNSSAEQLSEVEALLEQTPETLGDNTAKLYARRHAAKVVELAQQLVSTETRSLDELELTQAMLSRLAPIEDQAATVGDIKDKLAARVEVQRAAELERTLASEIEDLTSQLQTAIELTDDDLRFAVLSSLSQSLGTLRTELALQGQADALAISDPLQKKIDTHLGQSFTAIAQHQKAATSKARMRYQAWTLGEIEKLNDISATEAIRTELLRIRDSKDPVVVKYADFKRVRELFESELGNLNHRVPLTNEQQANVGAFINKNWDTIILLVKHDAAARHLLHVDQGLLDPPVTKFYNEAFEKIWQQIQDGDELQLSLARMTAQIPKRDLDEFTEE